MNIIETNIPNVVPDNIPKSKEVLANSIITNVYPLFNEVYNTRVDEIDTLKKQLDNKKELVKKHKTTLEQFMNEYKRKKKVSKLLDRIEKLISSGLVYDGTLKHETVVLLKIISKLSDEKLDYHLKDTMRTISKRFSR
jgi:ATP-dependent Lon protease